MSNVPRLSQNELVFLTGFSASGSKALLHSVTSRRFLDNILSLLIVYCSAQLFDTRLLTLTVFVRGGLYRLLI